MLSLRGSTGFHPRASFHDVTWSKAWKIVAGIGAVVALIAGVLRIAADWDRVEDYSTRFFEWLYPLGVILLLLTALIALVVVVAVVIRRNRAPQGYANEEEREHDRRVVREVRKRVSRSHVDWLRQHDFGGSWHADKIRGFMELPNDLGAVEYIPFDERLRYRLGLLRVAVHGFLEFYALNTFADRVGNENWRNIGWSRGEAESLRGEEMELWTTRRGGLHDHADAVAKAYDNFVLVARTLHLLDAPDPVARIRTASPFKRTRR